MAQDVMRPRTEYVLGLVGEGLAGQLQALLTRSAQEAYRWFNSMEPWKPPGPRRLYPAVTFRTPHLAGLVQFQAGIHLLRRPLLAAKSVAIRAALGINRPDFRMRDAELLLRFLAFDYFLSSYRGNLKDFLDQTCETLNVKWAELEDDVEARADACDKAIDSAIAVFGDDSFRSWVDGAYQGPFNRAMFDAMTRYFRAS